jgi:sialate O-acetylesterase
MFFMNRETSRTSGPKLFQLALAISLMVPLTTSAQVRLPQLISDGMVLQRDTDVKIWGWAAPGEEISVDFNGLNYGAVANESGDWEVRLSELKAGGPFSMTVAASNRIHLSNILIGDVWICSGQSNMEISMKRVSPLYEKEIAEAGNPNLRYLEIPKTFDFNTPQEDVSDAKWVSVGPDSILSMSAVAYFFALELYGKYNVPIGLINASVGGSPAEAWISEDSIKAFPEHHKESQRFKNSTLIRQIETEDERRSSDWHSRLLELDAGYRDPDQPWYAPELDTSDWPITHVPGYWANGKLGEVNGAVWFRKNVQIPESLVGKPARLLLGRIVCPQACLRKEIILSSSGLLAISEKVVLLKASPTR